MLIDAWQRAMPWVEDAACAVEPYSSWKWVIEANSARDTPTTPAARVEVCATCPVRRECLMDALTETAFTPEGVWGGTLRYERTAAWTAKMRTFKPDPDFQLTSFRQGPGRPANVGAGSPGERVTDADRHRIAEEIADEFEASLPERLASLQARADAHMAVVAARKAAREAAKAGVSTPTAPRPACTGHPIAAANCGAACKKASVTLWSVRGSALRRLRQLG